MDQSASSYRPHKKNMDSRIHGLQRDMTKLQSDLHQLQEENARVTQKNGKLEQELAASISMNEKLQAEINNRAGTKGDTADAGYARDASSAVGVRAQSGPNDANSTCTEPNARDILSSKLDSLPADVQTRLKGHVSNCEYYSRISWGKEVNYY